MSVHVKYCPVRALSVTVTLDADSTSTDALAVPIAVSSSPFRRNSVAVTVPVIALQPCNVSSSLWDVLPDGTLTVLPPIPQPLANPTASFDDDRRILYDSAAERPDALTVKVSLWPNVIVVGMFSRVTPVSSSAMRSISLSPSSHGGDATDQVRVLLAASTVACVGIQGQRHRAVELY